MTKVIAGIQGVPFRKIVSRRKQGQWIIETLSCGHENSALIFGRDSGATKRRCYHRECRITKKER